MFSKFLKSKHCHLPWFWNWWLIHLSSWMQSSRLVFLFELPPIPITCVFHISWNVRYDSGRPEAPSSEGGRGSHHATCWPNKHRSVNKTGEERSVALPPSFKLFVFLPKIPVTKCLSLTFPFFQKCLLIWLSFNTIVQFILKNRLSVSSYLTRCVSFQTVFQSCLAKLLLFQNPPINTFMKSFFRTFFFWNHFLKPSYKKRSSKLLSQTFPNPPFKIVSQNHFPNCLTKPFLKAVFPTHKLSRKLPFRMSSLWHKL